MGGGRRRQIENEEARDREELFNIGGSFWVDVILTIPSKHGSRNRIPDLSNSCGYNFCRYEDIYPVAPRNSCIGWNQKESNHCTLGVSFRYPILAYPFRGR